MKVYHTNEIRFLVPDEFVDRSITAFLVPPAQPAPGAEGVPGEFSLVITRERVQDLTVTLSTYVGVQIGAVSQQMPGFHLRERSRVTLDGEPAERVEFTWQTEGGAMVQQQVFSMADGVALTLTASAPEEIFPRYRSTLDRLLQSVKFQR